VTNSSLCNFGSNFRLVFTPDSRYYTSSYQAYKLSDSNPGQFFYNVFYTNDGSTDTITLEIPYPFVTQGAMPVHVYDSLTTSEEDGTVCFEPGNALAAYGFTFGLGNYTDTNGNGSIGFGDVYRVNVPAALGFQYINIHLDYGLEKTDGWIKQGSNAVDNPNLAPVRPNIINLTPYTFRAYADNVLIPGSTDTIYNENEFKQVRGFGGLVYLWDGAMYMPIPAATVKLYKGTSITPANFIETMTTDNDGWYLSNYVHRGKAATYTLVFIYASQTRKITVTAGGSLKFGEGLFYVGGPNNTPTSP
jgi:hypothetical protein